MKIIITEEQHDDLVEMMTDLIKSDGWANTTKLVGGDENLIELLGIKSPMEFLHFYDDMDVVNSEENKNKVLFRYNKGHNLMVVDKKDGFTYIYNPDIWSILEIVFGLNFDDIEKLINVWFDDVYNLRSIIRNLSIFQMDSFGRMRSLI